MTSVALSPSANEWNPSTEPKSELRQRRASWTSPSVSELAASGPAESSFSHFAPNGTKPDFPSLHKSRSKIKPEAAGGSNRTAVPQIRIEPPSPLVAMQNYSHSLAVLNAFSTVVGLLLQYMIEILSAFSSSFVHFRIVVHQQQQPLQQQPQQQKQELQQQTQQYHQHQHSLQPFLHPDLPLLIHHHQSLYPAQSHKCPSIVKLESLTLHIGHLRSIVDAERSARTEISKVHAKTVMLVEDQRDEILRLEGTVESLKDEVDRLSARLVEALFERSNTSVGSSRGNDSDDESGVDGGDILKSGSGYTNCVLSSVLKARLNSESDDDSDSDELDCDQAGDDDDADDDEGNEEDLLTPVETYISDSALVSSIFQLPSLESKVSESENKSQFSSQQSPIQLQSLATQNLLQSLHSNASPNTLPILLDSLSSTLHLPKPVAAMTAITALLAYMNETNPLLLNSASLSSASSSSSLTFSSSSSPSSPFSASMSKKALALDARNLFTKHILLLQIHCASAGAESRLSTLKQLALFCEDASSALKNDCPGGSCLAAATISVKPSARQQVLWRESLGMLVYVLVDLEIVEAEDVVEWWRMEGVSVESGEEGLKLNEACRVCESFLDRLVSTLEPYCNREDIASDSEEEDEDGDESDQNHHVETSAVGYYSCDEGINGGSEARLPSTSSEGSVSAGERRVSFNV